MDEASFPSKALYVSKYQAVSSLLHAKSHHWTGDWMTHIAFDSEMLYSSECHGPTREGNEDDMRSQLMLHRKNMVQYKNKISVYVLALYRAMNARLQVKYQ
jgi:hypothetical protein